MSGRAWAEILILSLIWGASLLSVYVALEEIGSLTSVAHWTFLAMLIRMPQVAYNLLSRRQKPLGIRAKGRMN